MKARLNRDNATDDKEMGRYVVSGNYPNANGSLMFRADIKIIVFFLNESFEYFIFNLFQHIFSVALIF